MKETQVKIGAVEFTTDTSNNRDPYVIGVFAQEHAGKTRFSLTGPDGVGYVVTETKSYVTIDKDAVVLGKDRIYKPKDPMAFIPSARKIAGMKTDVDKQKYYQEMCKRVEDTTFALLQHPDVKLVVIDKFTHYCTWKEFAINGMSERYIKIDGKVKQSKSEVRQGIIDFINAFQEYRKPVILNCATKGDYDVTDKEGNPLRQTWDAGCFYMLGSHCNLVVELQANQRWVPDSPKKSESWHYKLNIRRCQHNTMLEGPLGDGLLVDDEVSLPRLIQAVDPDVDIDEWM